jgi:hypothetical protein
MESIKTLSMNAKTTNSLASTLILLAVLGCLNELTAAVWVVDRNAANPAADFESLPEALEAAQPADTIYVMPSGNAYQLDSITKPITIIGSGYGKGSAFPRAANSDSKLGKFSITATNVFFSGLVFTGGNEGVTVVAPSKGITFFRNYFAGTDLYASAGADGKALQIGSLHVINNYFGPDSDVGLFNSVLVNSSIYTEVVDLVFANNIMKSGRFSFPNGDGDVFNNVLIMNTSGILFRETGPPGRQTVRSSGRVFNNIIGAVSNADIRLGDNLFANNMVNLENFTSPGANLIFKSLADVVVNIGAWGEPYVLTSDSPAKGAGLNGEDIGIYGGIHAWNPTLQPPLPIINRIEAPRVVGAGEGLKVTVEAQSNN